MCQLLEIIMFFPCLHMNEISILCSCFDQFIVIFQQVLVCLGKHSESICEACGRGCLPEGEFSHVDMHMHYTQGSFQQVSEICWSVIRKHWLLLVFLEEVPRALKPS